MFFMQSDPKLRTIKLQPAWHFKHFIIRRDALKFIVTFNLVFRDMLKNSFPFANYCILCALFSMFFSVISGLGWMSTKYLHKKTLNKNNNKKKLCHMTLIIKRIIYELKCVYKCNGSGSASVDRNAFHIPLKCSFSKLLPITKYNSLFS